MAVANGACLKKLISDPVQAGLTAWFLGVLVFERSREADWEKRGPPSLILIEQSQQNKLKFTPFSTLYTCPNEATYSKRLA